VKLDTNHYCRTISAPKQPPHRWVGIDPGASGGIVAIYKTGEVVCDKMPATTADLVALLKDYWGSPCYIEKVNAGPNMGSSAAFKFGQSAGRLEAAALAAAMEVHYISPQKWQKEFGLIVKGRGLGQGDTEKKNRNKARAQELYPGAKVTHFNADALLLATLCKRQQSN
jgi:hypothetical protein